jgi:hypothetical protein
MKIPSGLQGELKKTGDVKTKIDPVPAVLEKVVGDLSKAQAELMNVSKETAKAVQIAANKISEIEARSPHSYQVSVDRNDSGFISSMVIKPIKEL